MASTTFVAMKQHTSCDICDYWATRRRRRRQEAEKEEQEKGEERMWMRKETKRPKTSRCHGMPFVQLMKRVKKPYSLLSQQSYGSFWINLETICLFSLPDCFISSSFCWPLVIFHLLVFFQRSPRTPTTYNRIDGVCSFFIEVKITYFPSTHVICLLCAIIISFSLFAPFVRSRSNPLPFLPT